MSFASLKKKYLTKKNITESEISTFYKDLFLIWINCWKYNEDESDISETAEELGTMANKFIKKHILIQNNSSDRQNNSEESNRINSTYSNNINNINNNKNSRTASKNYDSNKMNAKGNNLLSKETVNLTPQNNQGNEDQESLIPANSQNPKENVGDPEPLIDKKDAAADVNQENETIKQENSHGKKDLLNENRNMIIEDFNRIVEEELGNLSNFNKDYHIYNDLGENTPAKTQDDQDLNYQLDLKEQAVLTFLDSKSLKGENNNSFDSNCKSKNFTENPKKKENLDKDAKQEPVISLDNNQESAQANEKIDNENANKHNDDAEIISIHKANDKLNEKENTDAERNFEAKVSKKPRYTKSLREKADDLQDDIINFANRVRGNKNTDIFNYKNNNNGNIKAANALTEISFKRERKPVDYKDRDTLKNLLRQANVKSESSSFKKPVIKAQNSSNEKKPHHQEPVVKSNKNPNHIINNSTNNNSNNHNNKTNHKDTRIVNSNSNYSNNNDKKPLPEKSLNGLDPFPENIQKRIPKKPQKYADEEFESESINISGKDRNEESLIKNKKNIENFNNNINDIIKNIANSGRIIKPKIIEANRKESIDEHSENKFSDDKKKYLKFFTYLY